jgi:uncharacterized OB-fold protein
VIETIMLPDVAAGHWEGASQGELRVPHCENCEHLWMPPTRHCPNCLSDQVDWRAVSALGRVLGVCVFHRSYIPGIDLELPYAVIHVALDAGPHLYSNPFDPGASLAVGDRVEAVYVLIAEGQALVRFRSAGEDA